MSRVFFLALLMMVLEPGMANAQLRMSTSDAQRLRAASALESRGDYQGAEEILLELLHERPDSDGGLFALERILRHQGEIIRILGSIDSFLEREPESSGVRFLKLRVLTDVDSLQAVRREAEVWLDTQPEDRVAYREVGRAYERAFGAAEALRLLRRGRGALGPNSLAMEIGDMLAAMDDPLGAAEEWALAVGDDGSQISTVVRRVQALTKESEEAAKRVVERLAASVMPARRKAAARAALDLNIRSLVFGLVRDAANDLEGRERSAFLSDAARRARDRGLNEVASWAYDQLGAGASTLAERRQFDQGIVDAALAAGDTVGALEAQIRVAGSFSAGSVDRRRAMAQVIRLETVRSGPSDLRSMLRDFIEAFPNAPEVDELAATVAAVLQSLGDASGASAVLDGVEGPRSSLERGYLLLAEGDLEEGRSALLLAHTGLPAADATAVIQFASLLGRLSSAAASVLADAGVKAHRGQYLEAALGLSDSVAGLDLEEAPPVLAEAARIAVEGEERELAADLRSRLIQEYPNASETAEAALALARYRAQRPQGVEEAIRLLEELITKRPNAAIVPDARIELQRLQG